MKIIFLDIDEVKNVEFISQYRIPGVSFIYDFYLPKYNLLIEYNGDYWHANPKKYKSGTLLKRIKCNEVLVEEIWERDRTKRKEAEDKEYKLTYIWEDDYKDRGEKILVDLINSYI